MKLFKSLQTRNVILLVFFSGLTAGLTGCSGSDTQNDANTVSEKMSTFRKDTAEVRVAEVQLRNFERSFTANGTLVPKQKATLRILVGGQVINVFVDISDQVHSGDLLLQIRKSDYEQALAQSEANLARARAAYNNAEREMKRIKNLYEIGSTTEQARDQAVTRYEEAQANLKQAEAAYQTAKQNLEDSSIVSPFNGVITERYFDANEYARSGDDVFEIMDLSVMDAEIQVPEVYLGSLTKGLDVDLSFKSNYEDVKGRIVAVNPKVDRSTRTFKIKVRVQNPEMRLPAGLFVTGAFNLPDATDQLAVPREAVESREGETIVWVIKKGKAHRRVVSEGPSNENWVMISGGLQLGEVVAVEGLGVLINDYPVKILGDDESKTTSFPSETKPPCTESAGVSLWTESPTPK